MKRIERHRSSRCFLTLSLLPTLKVQGEHHMCVKQRESCSYMKKYYYTVGIFSNERKSHKKECPLCAAFFFTYTGEDRVCVAHPFDMREAVTSHMYTYTHIRGVVWQYGCFKNTTNCPMSEEDFDNEKQDLLTRFLFWKVQLFLARCPVRMPREYISNCGNRDQSNIPFESFPFNKPKKKKRKRGILKEKVIFRKTGGTLHLEYTRKRLSFFIYSGLFLSPKRRERKKNFVMREAYNEFSGIPYGYWRGR